jgi:hypothetical protein
MKQLLIAALFILIGFNSYSQYQTQKGRWIITHTIANGGPYWYSSKSYEDGVLENSYKGKETQINAAFTSPWWGEIEFEREKYPTPKPSYVKETDLSFSIEPQAGYFIKDNLMIGAAFLAGFDIYNEKEEAEFDKSNSWYVGLGPVARYYIGNKKKHRAFVGFESRAYVQTGTSRNQYFSNNKLIENSIDRDAFGFRVKPYAGYALFLGKHWTADAHIGFLYEKDDYKGLHKSYTDKVMNNGYPYEQRNVYENKMLSLNVGIAYTF